MAAFGLALCVAVFWAVAPLLASRASSIQMAAWIPEWSLAVAIGGLGVFAVGCERSGRRRWVGCLFILVLLSGPLFGSSIREFRWFAFPRSGTFRLVFLNAQDPAAPEARDLWTVIDPLGADLLVFSNPGYIAPEWRQLPGPRSAYSTITWLSPFLVASKSESVSLRTMSRRDEIRAVAVEFDASPGSTLDSPIHRLAVIDLPSDWERNREELMGRLVDAIERYEEGRPRGGFDLIVGDFNSTPRSPSWSWLEPAYRDGFESAGAGWGATWPRRFPILRIDAVFANWQRGLRIASVRTFDPGQGGHRGLIVDLEGTQPSMPN